MSGSASDYLELKLLEHSLGKTSFTMPATVAIALCTVVPDDTKTGATITEVTNANSYARKTVAGTDWNSAASGSISNVNAITFVTATGAGWGAIVGFAIVDSATWGAGNMLYWGSLTSKTISAGDTATFAGGAPGDLVVTMD
jgi:hypothetical protein